MVSAMMSYGAEGRFFIQFLINNRLINDNNVIDIYNYDIIYLSCFGSCDVSYKKLFL